MNSRLTHWCLFVLAVSGISFRIQSTQVHAQTPQSAEPVIELKVSADHPGATYRVGEDAAFVTQVGLSAVRAGSDGPSLDEARAEGIKRSEYLRFNERTPESAALQPQLETFQELIQPILKKACVECHGPDQQEGNIRIDTLNPDLHQGPDVSWWVEVFAVISKGEMPPQDATPLSDEDRSRIVDWLSREIQTASMVRRQAEGQTSFRRMTRYEYNYALQDLLGLPFDFAKELPPDSSTGTEFQNSSELLHMSAQQFEMYRDLGRRALMRATVRGEKPPELYWGISMAAASAREWSGQDAELAKIRETHQSDPVKLEEELKRRLDAFRSRPGQTHYSRISDGRKAVASWSYPEAQYAWAPTDVKPEVPIGGDVVAVLPSQRALIVELGDRIPDEGTLRVRVRAARQSTEDKRIPSLQLEFGWQASNDSEAAVRISREDLKITATSEQPEFYEWNLPLSEIYPRNLVRNVNRLGDLPSPSEFIKLVNSSVGPDEILIDYVEVTAPVFDTWPPASHRRIFTESTPAADETEYASRILNRFMTAAWRRAVTEDELRQKLDLFHQIRPSCMSFEEAMIEVLATVLASPKFLYLVQTELATRLSMFLWCSIPDEELLTLAAEGRLADREILASQVQRMLNDPRARRFSERFTEQWLGTQLLSYLKVDRKEYPQFDPQLKEAMLAEPALYFHEVLRHNQSVIDFLHSDYAIVNERLAQHYGLPDVVGNEFRRVALLPEHRRGGLLTQAGLLAMNSDGKDSHPLKRGIWMLEKLLNDPPAPPPPAVPRIDLADPEIAKLTLKERLANHRDQAACRSCHSKIDPWGIAFENFDAIGNWRTEVRGQPVDASSLLYNSQELNGIDGLKVYLLEHRQDQFVQALAHKLTSFALGRPLTFGDHAAVDQIAAETRRNGDGLATLITQVVLNDLFQAP